jgi:hypothetical protein
MPNGEEGKRMPPNSTQNLNAKLSPNDSVRSRPEDAGLTFSPPPIHNSGPPVQIVGASARYQGGYHLSGV